MVFLIVIRVLEVFRLLHDCRVLVVCFRCCRILEFYGSGFFVFLGL